MTSNYLFDSHALLSFFQEEKGAEAVAKIIEKAQKHGLDRLKFKDFEKVLSGHFHTPSSNHNITSEYA